MWLAPSPGMRAVLEADRAVLSISSLVRKKKERKKKLYTQLLSLIYSCLTPLHTI